MDANKTFNCLLSDIENSGLNFFVSKTPFSASISLRSSYAKHFHEAVKKSESKPVDLPQCEVPVYNLENLKLQKQIESLKKQVLEQNIFINERLENEKKLKVSNEEQASESRADLLKVKKEKNKLCSQIKVLEDENGSLKVVIDDLKCKMNEAQKIEAAKISESKALAKEINQLKLDVRNLDGEIEVSKAKYDDICLELKKMNQCNLCDHKEEIGGNMKGHIQEVHSQNQQSKTYTESIFDEYPCHYCSKRILSKQDHESMTLLPTLVIFVVLNASTRKT